MSSNNKSGYRFLAPAVLLGALTWTFIDFAKIMAGFQQTSSNTKRNIVAFYHILLVLSLFLSVVALAMSEYLGLGFVEYLSSV